ncbi:isoprenyl transferase [Faunimonas pinastri]|nr:isoprenyl transferase [Faunimonas pinastri]
MASPGVPRHVAIIMDGNGRWARARGLPRAEGHRRGVEALRRAVRFAATRGIDYLTLFSFSSENWSRPASEVGELLDLLRLFIRRDVADLKRDNVRIRVIGNRETLPPDIIALLQHAERETALCTGLHLVVAFNYGSRDEITRAVRRIAERVERGELRASDIDAAMVEQGLDTAGIPDPDLILRTSGEQRVSNFLLWQAAYSEFVFLPGLWPDFDDPQFEAALEQYSCRERRYGGVVSA